MAKINPFKFLQEVRAEGQKVTWPTRRETAITTAMVFVMVAVTSVFFLIADQIMRLVVTFLLGIGSRHCIGSCYSDGFWGYDHSLVHRAGLFQFRAKGRQIDSGAVEAAASVTSVRRDQGADREGRR